MRVAGSTNPNSRWPTPSASLRGAVGSAFARAQAHYGTELFGLVVFGASNACRSYTIAAIRWGRRMASSPNATLPVTEA